MSAPIQPSSQQTSQQVSQLSNNTQDGNVAKAAKNSFEVKQLHANAFNQLIQAALDDKATLAIDISVDFDRVHLPQQTAVMPPQNSPVLSVARGAFITPIDLPPPAKNQ